MNYQYVDVIPAKVIFKIESTLNFDLLLPYTNEGETTAEVWEVIEQEHQDISPDNKNDKNLDLFKTIEALRAKYESIQLAVLYLSKLWDNELADKLIEYGFSIEKNNYNNLEDMTRDEQHQAALEIVSKQSEAILIKINNALAKLDKKNDKKVSKTSFEETILSYSAFTGVGYVDANKVTLMEYYALISLGQEKIKALEKGGKTK